jgi:hypothetical protein
MRKKPGFFLFAALAFSFVAAAPAQAQSTRTWVSGVGDDAMTCSRTAPCKTFAGAISKTTAGGEINCLDPGGFGAVTITKSISIDCHDVMGSVLVAGTAGIIVSLDSVSNMIVRLRNINFNGLLSGTTAILITGTNAGSGNSAVSIEDCLIDGFTTQGIFDSRNVGGRLFIKNTTIRNNFGTGVAIAAASGVTTNRATLVNVNVFDSNVGFGIGNGVQAILKNSVSAGNTSSGVVADTGSTVMISGSTISANGIGITASGTVRVRDSDIVSNTVGFSGTIQSFVNNGIASNGAGGTITPVAGGVTNPQGQQ